MTYETLPPELTEADVRASTPEDLVQLIDSAQVLIDTVPDQHLGSPMYQLLVQHRRLAQAELVRRAVEIRDRSTQQIVTLSAAINAVPDPHNVLSELLRQAQQNHLIAHKGVQYWAD